MESLLITGGTVLTMGKPGVIENGAVYIEGDRIVRVGKADEVRGPADEVIDARGKAVLPGLINTHTHIYQNLLKGQPDTLALVEWCDQVLFPFCRVVIEDALKGNLELMYLASQLGYIEALKSGTTTLVNMDIAAPIPPEVAAQVGVRMVFVPNMADAWIPEDLIRPTSELLGRLESFIREWHGAANGRITVMAGPSAPFDCTEEFLLGCAELARKYGVGIHTHVAETRYEIELMKRTQGVGPLEYLDRLGLLDVKPFVAVHCVWLNDRELDLLRQKGVGVSHNPESNMRLASGVAPIPKIRELGVPVGLATDGSASNDNLDMFEEMRSAVFLHKVSTLNPSALTARDALKMATIEGARAIGMEREIGSIEPGKKADLILVDLKKPHLQPIYDLVNTLVYCARGSDVVTTIVDGRVIVRDGRLLTIDEEQVLEKAQEIARSLYERMDRHRPG